jgi:hypothetical protein
MKYTTTSSRRVVMVKIKTRPEQNRAKPPPSRNDSPAMRADRATVPELFARSSPARAAVATSAPWWSHWKTILLTLTLLIALLAAIQLMPGSDEPRQKADSNPPPAAAGFPQAVQIRPMGFAGSASAAGSGAGSGSPGLMPGGSPSGGAGLAAGGFGAALASASEGRLSVRNGRSETSYSTTAGEINQALQDGSRKLVLPADIAGSCDLGDAGSKALSACLARNGAHAE